MSEIFTGLAVAGAVGAAVPVVFFALAAAEQILRFDRHDGRYWPQFSRRHGLGVRPAADGQPARITIVPRP